MLNTERDILLPTSEKERQQPSRLDKRFEGFSQAVRGLESYVFSLKPQEVGNLNPGQIDKLVKEINVELKGALETIANNAFVRYVEKEKSITEWWQRCNLDNLERKEELVKPILRFLNGGQDFAANSIKLERIHGGIALSISPEDFVALLIAKLETEGEFISDQKEIQQKLSSMAEVGFVFDRLPGLPQEFEPLPDFKLVIVQNTPGADKAVKHEELEILLGFDIDKAIEKDRIVKKIEALAPTVLKDESARTARNRVRQAIYDLAAKTEDGALVNSLGNLSISRRWAEEHPIEAELIFQLVLQVKEKLGLIGRQKIADLLRSGAIRPENLYLYFSGQPYTPPKEGVQKENYYNTGEIVPITKEGKEGRFVFNEATLKVSDQIANEGIVYEVTDILYHGGQGVIYKAKEIGGGKPENVVIKEMIFEAAETFLFYHNQLLDELKQKWTSIDPLTNQKTIDSAGVYNDILKYAGVYYVKTILGDETAGKGPVAEALFNMMPHSLCQSNIDELEIFLDDFFDPHSKLANQRPPQRKKTVGEIVKDARMSFSEAKQKFMNEAQILHSLNAVEGIPHSRGMQIMSVGDLLSGQKFSDSRWERLLHFMEFVKGENLDEVLKLNRKKYTTRETQQVFPSWGIERRKLLFWV